MINIRIIGDKYFATVYGRTVAIGNTMSEAYKNARINLGLEG